MPVIQPEVDYIDKKTKTIKFKDGRSEPLSDEAAYSLFESKGARDIRTQAKSAEKELANTTSPEGYTFLRNFGSSIVPKAINEYVVNPSFAAGRAIKTREGQEEMGFLSRMYENLEARQRGAREGLNELSQENPYSALAGGVSSFVADIATPLPKALSGRPVMAGAALGALSGEKPIYEDPSQSLKNAAIGGGIGYGVGKLQKVANQRQALRQHPENVRMATEANQAAQSNFVRNVDQKLTGLDNNLPKSGIKKMSLDIPKFIDAEINFSNVAGTSEATGLVKFFETLEKGIPETLREKDIKKIYQILESKAAKASANEAPLIQKFGEHIVNVLPEKAGQALAKEKYGTKLVKSVQNSMSKTADTLLNDSAVLKEISRQHKGMGDLKNFKSRLFETLEKNMDQLDPEVFSQAFENNQLNALMGQMIERSSAYQQVKQISERLLSEISSRPNGMNTKSGKNVLKMLDYLDQLKSEAVESAAKMMQKNSLQDFQMTLTEGAEKIASKMSNATGIKNPYISKNIQPSNMRPIPQQMPPPPNAGRMANAFENPNFYGDMGKKAIGRGGVSGLIASHLLGAGNVAAGAGSGLLLSSGLRGATRPDALGNINRLAIQRGGTQAIAYAIIEKPSYTNGILLDPQDRRDMVAEIENNPQISLGDKAVLQAKINRGISIEKMLEKYEI